MPCTYLVDGEQRERLARVRAEVARDDVLRLDAVLDEEGLAHCFEDHGVLDAQEVDAVDGDGAVVRVMNRGVANVRAAHRAWWLRGEGPLFWSGLRRGPGATASFQDAQTARWGA